MWVTVVASARIPTTYCPGSGSGGFIVAGTASVTESGSQISGNTVSMVIVKTNPAYQPNRGHAGTGTVADVLC